MGTCTLGNQDLIASLILTSVWATTLWNTAGNVAMDMHGWIALWLGIFFSLLIGRGLMALMFFSSRSGYDESGRPPLKEARAAHRVTIPPHFDW